MVFIGVFFYGVIGVAYPIYGAVIAHVASVSFVYECCSMQDYTAIFISGIQ